MLIYNPLFLVRNYAGRGGGNLKGHFFSKITHQAKTHVTFHERTEKTNSTTIATAWRKKAISKQSLTERSKKRKKMSIVSKASANSVDIMECDDFETFSL
jgi:hypothetical protein